jgi:hypothetical protein
MKYVVDTDALIDCFDCLKGDIKVNGIIYVPLELAKEFINRFPKDPIKEEETND